MKMKAAIYTGIEQIAIHEVERNEPPPGFVLVNTKQTGICGSDLHSYFGHWGQSHENAAGHETCGIVTALGDGVTDFDIGTSCRRMFLHAAPVSIVRPDSIISASIEPGFLRTCTGGSQNTQRRTIQDSLNYRKG